jgi:myo-inositol-1-phosphate synthase
MTINVAIAGLGSCASALIQGIQWYKSNPNETVGICQPDIGGYSVTDVKFVAAFDIDARKVRKVIRDALFELPNCNMRHVDSVESVLAPGWVYRGPTLDGFPRHLLNYPESVRIVESSALALTADQYMAILKDNSVDVLLNYMPVGSDEASKFYIENAIRAGVHVINCMPSYISTDEAMVLEQMAIDHGVTIVGSDMRSSCGASRMSEVIEGMMLDAGLLVTQHIQTNMAAGSSQGQENIRTGRTANQDFLVMAEQARLKNKHISKENVLAGQSVVRGVSTAGQTKFAGPSLTVIQRPGGTYIGTDNKIANFDIIAYGWAGARYEFTGRLSVQDSPNSGAIVIDAIRYCKVAAELGVVGYLRGASAYSQKTPPVQMKTEDAKFECDALARRILTPMVEAQLKINNPSAKDLAYTFQDSKTAYDCQV